MHRTPRLLREASSSCSGVERALGGAAEPSGRRAREGVRELLPCLKVPAQPAPSPVLAWGDREENEPSNFPSGGSCPTSPVGTRWQGVGPHPRRCGSRRAPLGGGLITKGPFLGSQDSVSARSFRSLPWKPGIHILLSSQKKE